MRTVITLTSVAVLGASASLAMAQPGQDHAAHHPQAASAPVTGARNAPAASAASGGMGIRMDAGGMKKMHDEKHKPGGMHDQMQGKDGPMMRGMPAASAASR